MVHRNRYFAPSLAGAIAVAARMEIEWRDLAEEVVTIRPATDEEAALYLKVSDYFYSQMPRSISEAGAANLPKAERDRGMEPVKAG